MSVSASPAAIIIDINASHALLVGTASLVTTLIHESNMSAPATPSLLLILPKIADESPNCCPHNSEEIGNDADHCEQVVVNANPVIKQLLRLFQIHENALVLLDDHGLLVLQLDEPVLRLIQLGHDSLVVAKTLLVLFLESNRLLAQLTLILTVTVLLLSQGSIQSKIELLLDLQFLLFALYLLL